jgi:hypothetical protein
VSQHVRDPAHLISADLAWVILLEKALQTSVAERPDHRGTVPCIGTGVNRSSSQSLVAVKAASILTCALSRRLGQGP